MGVFLHASYMLMSWEFQYVVLVIFGTMLDRSDWKNQSYFFVIGVFLSIFEYMMVWSFGDNMHKINF